MGDIRIVMTLDEHGVVKKTQELDKALAELGKTAGTTRGQANSFGSDLTSKLIPSFTLATLAADGIRKTFGFLKDQFVETFGAAIEAEKVDRALESSLQIVGQAGGGAAETLKRYASALQRKTIYDDEAIKSAQALIIQMRGTASQIDVVTKGAIGLASVFGMDLDSAARAVAQGFEGNYRAIGMLIPQVRQATTDGEKHAAMMQGLANYYQRAESDVSAFGNRLIQIKETYSNLQEAVGDVVIKNKTVLASLEGIKSMMEWLEMQTKKSAASGKKAIWEYIPPILAFTSVTKSLGAAARKSLDDYEKSWEGWTASFLNARRLAIDPIPIVIQQKVILPLTESQKALAEDMRYWRMWGVNIERASSETATTLAGIIGGMMGQLEDYKETGEDVFSTLKTAYKQYADVITKTEIRREIALLEKTLRDLGKDLPDSEVKRLREEIKRLKKELGDTSPIDKFAEAMNRIYDQSTQAFSGLDAIFSQTQTNREIAIENEYKKRLAYINANITDETARQNAIAALEAEYQIKRSSAAAAGAKQRKAIATMEAIVNTASAVTEALPNIFLAALVGALGAVQIGVIAAQPIPLAKGALFNEPTLLPATRGRSFALAEAGSAEIVSPVPTMRQIVREELRAGGSRGGDCYIEMAVTIQAQRLDDAAIDQAGARIFRAVNDQLRIHGRPALARG